MGPDEMDDRKISPKKASWELIDVDGTDKVIYSAATLKFVFLSRSFLRVESDNLY